MNTWYFKIQGKSEANKEINDPFGFYVSCLLSVDIEVNEAKKLIVNDLSSDGYDIVKFEHYGRYEEFYWDDKEIQLELDELADESKKNPGVIHYSTFHTWKY